MADLSLPDLDAAVIETRELDLTEYAAMAIEKGLPIHMDKPGGLSHAEYTRLLRTAKEKGILLHTGYMYRYNPAVLALYGMIEKGELGEIYSVEAHMDCWHGPKKRQWLEQFPGGMMFFLGCHLIDLIYRIQGEPEEVLPMNMPTGLDGVTAQDYGMAVLKYKNGVSFAKTCAAELGGFSRRQLVVCGSKATVELKPFERKMEDGSQTTDMRIITREDVARDGWVAQGSTVTLSAFRYDDMMRAFAAMVRGERTNPYSYDYEEKLHALVQRACGFTDTSV